MFFLKKKLITLNNVARSRWKYNFFGNFFFKKIYKSKFSKIFFRRLFCRNFSIPVFFKKKYVLLHKGNKFTRFEVNKFQFFYKFGEFSFTRKPFSFVKKKKIKR